jgi:PAT family beta-lactamase induction signal transducer AmpG
MMAQLAPNAEAARPGFAQALAVYLRPRVLIVMFLGFSSGLPLALSGSTLQVWASESGVDLTSIGLFALVATPYAFKFLWAPLVDALDVPLLARWLGRRRGWLIFSQLLLIGAILYLSSCDPASSLFNVALGALLVATVSATQDIVVDAFRIESLPENEQAAGMAGYVAAYRIGMLVSTAGALYLVSFFEKGLGFTRGVAWHDGFLAMAGLVVVGMVASIVATEPNKSAAAIAAHARNAMAARVIKTAIDSFLDFFSHDRVLVVLMVLAFVILYKFTDAFAGAMTATFVIRIGFSRDEYATIIKGVGLAATLLGGFAGGFVARRYPLTTSLWIGGIVQALANLGFSCQALIGANQAALVASITLENFTSAIGTVIYVAYLSALCRNPLHTATQYALLTALAAFGRTFLSAGAGFVAERTGWVLFFVICAAVAIPSLVLLWLLQRSGHFARLHASTTIIESEPSTPPNR